ncbi:tandem-95 repeat protein [Sphingobacteriales bacterium UPWRP_1]|nr:hypothetical protein BVG80_03905 [Sphingobacteriales bacterium TSM_CSM]PSJ75713.1 tandem-95 repeat protein [Sphingobacteriales bacterium UPWRP_1]
MKHTAFLPHWITLLLLVVVGTAAVKAQNLVPNSGFENFTNCPASLNSIENADDWVSATDGNPDYFNICADGISGVDVPANFYGVQQPLDGNGYAGFLAYSPDNSRDYVSIQLTEPLIPGKAYCVSFHISLADFTYFAVENIGLYFSSSAVNVTNGGLFLGYTPQIVNTFGPITDKTDGWVTISGTYTASAPYQWITIGNFASNANSNVQDLTVPGITGPLATQAYYYLDEVVVTQLPDIEVNISPAQVLCEGGEVTLTAIAGGDTYTWAAQSDPFTILSTENALTTTVTNTQSFIVTAQSGFCTRQKIVTVQVVAPAPEVDFTYTAACTGGLTLFTDLSSNVAPGSLYEWDFDSDGLADAFTFGGAAYTFPAAGLFPVKLTVYAFGGACQIEKTVIVEVSDNCNPCQNPNDVANFVPNPQMEYYTACPNSLGDIDHATPWFSPTSGSTDYFNACNTGSADVPGNSFGTAAAFDGNGYLGFFAYGNNYREYASVRLAQPLNPGQTYCVSFQVQLSSLSGKAIDNIGLYFSTDSIGLVTQAPLYLTPDISNTPGNILDDLMGWVTISGNYTPTTPVAWITIGNFADDATTQWANMPSPSPALTGFGYYYLDDVVVTPVPNLLNTNFYLTCTNTVTTLIANNNFCAYEWIDLANPGVVLGTSQALEVENPQAGVKQYVVTAQYGHCSKSEIVTVQFNAPPLAGFTVLENCAGGATIFADTSTSVLPGALYEWDFENDGVVNSTETSFVAHIYDTPGNYTAKLTVTNPGGCKDSMLYQITIANCNQSCNNNNVVQNNSFETGVCPNGLGQADSLDLWETPGSGLCAAFSNQCLNVVLLPVVENPNGSHTFTINITNLCPQHFVFASFELSGGATVESPNNGNSYNGTHGIYLVSHPVLAPFNAILYFDPSGTNNGFSDGETETFVFTLAAGVPVPNTMQFLVQLSNSLSFVGSISTQLTSCLVADWFSTCSASPEAGVPQNAYGSQLPFEGNGYAGLTTYSNLPDLRSQYLSTHLNQPLVVGQTYCATMYVNLADSSRYADTNLGMYFSTTALDDNLTLSEPPQVYNPQGNYLYDKENWVAITDTFTATQPYEYITIGNFDFNPDVPVLVGGSSSGFAYYYIDNIVVNPLTVEAPADTVVCQTTSLTLTANTNTCETYWYRADAPNTVLSINNTLQITATDTATYVVAGKNGDCTLTDTVTVFVKPLPLAEAGGPFSVCLGETVQLTATGGDAYAWIPMPNTYISDTSVANPFVAGYILDNFYFKVVVTDNTTGCQSVDSVLVKTLQLPTANIVNPDTVYLCSGDTISLGATGGVGGGPNGIPYLWQPLANIAGSNTVANPLVTAADTSVLTVTVTNTFTGCRDSASVVLIPRAPYQTHADTITICTGDTAVLAPSLPQANLVSYSWSPAFNLSATDVPNPTTFTNTGLTYTLTYTDDLGCTGQSTVLVRVIPRPNAGNDIQICEGGSAQLFASGGGLSYSWSPAGSLSNASAQNPIAAPSETTTYTVTVIYPNAEGSGCANTDSVTVFVNSSGFAFAGNDVVVCQGESTQLNAIGGNSYQWLPAEGLNATDIANPIASPANTTLYTVTVTNEVTGCQSVDDVLVTVDTPETPIINNADGQIYCADPLVPLQICYSVTYDGCAPLIPNVVTQLSSNVTFNAPTCFTYTSAFAASRTDTITLQVCAGGAGCSQITAIVVDCDSPPVWLQQAQSIATCVNNPVSFELPPSFDADGSEDVLTYSTGAADNGTVALNGTTATYTPNSGYTGNDFFEVYVCDALYPSGQCDTLFVVATIAPNSAPQVFDQTLNVPYQTPTNICLNITDPDGQGTSLAVATPPANGTIEILTGSCLIYTPNNSYSGSDFAVISVCDPCGLCSFAELFFNVLPKPNVPPVSPDILVNVPYNTTQEICLNVFDEDGDPATTQLVSGSVNGTLVIDAAANCITFTPDAGFSGVNVVLVNVCDGISGCDQVTITLNVLPAPNLPPIVNNVSATTAYNTPVFICLGIVEPNGNPYSVGVVDFPDFGTAVQPVAGCFIYTPINYEGTDSIGVLVCDNLGACSTATIYLNVLPQANQPPIVPDFTVVVPNATLPVVACLDIVEPDGDNYTTTILNNGIYGSAEVNNPDCFTYTPGAGFTNFDIVQFNVCDEGGACELVNVYFVNNAPPAINNVTLTTTQNVPVNVCLTITDPENEAVTLSILDGTPQNGTAVITNDTCILYTPNPGYVGTDQISVQACDINGNCSLGTINITIQEQPNQAPVINNTFSTTAFNTPITVCMSVTEPDGDDFSTVFGSSNFGSVIPLNDTCFSYIPGLNFSGSDGVTVTVCDVFGSCSSATAFITVFSNLPPSAENVTVATNAGQPVAACIEPSDPENDATAITITTQPANGTALITNDTCISYIPGPGFAGTDVVQLQLCDVFNNCVAVSVTVIVNSVNVAPVITPVAPIITTVGADEIVCITATDPNGDNLTYAIINVSPDTGTAVMDGNCLNFEAPQSGTGSIDVTIQVCDNGVPSLCSIVVVTFVLNYPPTAPAESVTIPQNTLSTVVCLTITEPDGNDYTLDITGNPVNGNAALDDNCLVYSPDPLFVGTETIVITLCDEYGECSSTTVTINVTDALNADDDSAQTEDNVPAIIPVLNGDVYPTDGTTTVSLTGAPASGSVTLNTDNTITYTATPGFTGADTFYYQICHPVLLCDEAMVVVTVSNALDAFNDLGNTTFADISVNIPILANDVYPDLTNLDIAIINEGDINGFVSEIGTTGVFTYLPASGFTGIDTFLYVISYPNLGSDTAMVVINVTEAPQYPNAADDAATTQINIDVVIDVLGNDTNPLPGNLTVVSIAAEPVNGTATINIDQSITYAPDNGFYGIDSFTYVVCNPNFGDGQTICDTATVVVTVENPAACVPKAYGAISPNGDGKNDYFVIENLDCNGYESNELVIFNRWGNVVFEAENYGAANWWDGTFKDSGNIVPDGTYFYILTTNTGGVELQGYLEVNQ